VPCDPSSLEGKGQEEKRANAVASTPYVSRTTGFVSVPMPSISISQTSSSVEDIGILR
jgi:hypothetical protein